MKNILAGALTAALAFLPALSVAQTLKDTESDATKAKSSAAASGPLGVLTAGKERQAFIERASRFILEDTDQACFKGVSCHYSPSELISNFIAFSIHSSNQTRAFDVKKLKEVVDEAANATDVVLLTKDELNALAGTTGKNIMILGVTSQGRAGLKAHVKGDASHNLLGLRSNDGKTAVSTGIQMATKLLSFVLSSQKATAFGEDLVCRLGWGKACADDLPEWVSKGANSCQPGKDGPRPPC